MAELKTENKVLAKGTFWALAGQLSTKFFSFFYVVLIAQIFRPEDIGVFYLGLGFLSLIAVIANPGFGAAFARYIPYLIGKGEYSKARSLTKFSYILVGLFSGVSAIAVFVFAPLIADHFKNNLLVPTLQWLSGYVFLDALFSLSRDFLQSRKKIRDSNLLTIGQVVLKLVLTFGLLFWFSADAIVLSIGFTLSFFLIILPSIWKVKEELNHLPPTKIPSVLVDVPLLREVIPFGFALSIVGALWTVVSSIDKTMIGYLSDPHIATTSVAVYTIATSLAGLLLLFPGSIVSIFFPLLSEFYGAGKLDKMRNLCTTAARWVVVLLIPITLVFIAFADNLLELFYGSEYSAGSWALIIFALGLFLRSLSNIHASLLAILRLIRLELTIALVSTILNISLNLLLIPRYGIEGAAVASLLSFVVASILFIHYSKSYFDFGFSFRDLLKPLLAGLLALGIIFLLKESALSFMQEAMPSPTISNSILQIVFQKTIKLSFLGVLFLFSLAIYFLALVVLKSFKPEDIELTSAALRRARMPSALILFVQRIMGGPAP